MPIISGTVKITTDVSTLAHLLAFVDLIQLAGLDPNSTLKASTRIGGGLQRLTVEGDIATPAHLKTAPTPPYSPIAVRS